MKPILKTFFQSHLYFDENSKEYALDECMKILGLIARVKDRNNDIIEMSRKFYGCTEKGVRTTESEFDRYEKNKLIINRLQRYYNNKITNLVKFKI